MKVEDYADRLAALVPCYDDEGGNATRVYSLDGAFSDDKRTLRWLLKRIARYYSKDLEALRRNYGKYLSLSQGVPLPFSRDLVLVPLKLRRAIGLNDGSAGYVNCKAVVKVEDFTGDENFRSKIILAGKNELNCFFTRKTVERRLKLGELAREKFLYTNNQICHAPFKVREGASGGDLSPELLMAMGKAFIELIK